MTGKKIIGNYIVDFYCCNCQVVIEIDGSSHDDKEEYDRERDDFLESLGLTVIHIRVEDILKNLDVTMRLLLNHPAFQAPLQERGMNHPALKGTPPMEGNLVQESP